MCFSCCIWHGVCSDQRVHSIVNAHSRIEFILLLYFNDQSSQSIVFAREYIRPHHVPAHSVDSILLLSTMQARIAPSQPWMISRVTCSPNNNANREPSYFMQSAVCIYSWRWPSFVTNTLCRPSRRFAQVGKCWRILLLLFNNVDFIRTA